MNQADHIERVIRAHHGILTRHKISFELIAMVNGSRDTSYQVCKKIAKKLASVSTYELKESGYGLGVLHGLKQTTGKYLCYANSARVHSDELLRCIKFFLKDPNTVLYAARKKRDVWYRRFSSLIYNGFCTLFMGISSSDINGTPKIFKRSIYKKLNLQFTNSMIDVEFFDKIKRFAIPVKEFPIYRNTRHGGVSTSRFSTIFRLIKEVIHYWYMTRIRH